MSITATEIVFIEGNVADAALLAAQMGVGREVHVLDPMQDGLAQIAQLLAGRSGIAALHLVSHGAQGVLELGSLTLDASSLAAHASQLAAIGASLSSGADILLYGCDVGAGSAGEAFVQQVAAATGADVAASSDATGAANLGGDWDLEIASGDVDAAPAVDAALAAMYTDILSLGSTTINFGTSGNFVSSGGTSSAADNIVYRVGGSSSYEMNIDGASAGIYANTSTGVVYTAYGTRDTGITISFTGRNAFTPTSITAGTIGLSNETMVFKGYDASGSLVTSQTSSTPGGGGSGTITLTGFTDIATLKILPSGASNFANGLTFDDLAISSVGAPNPVPSASDDSDTTSEDQAITTSVLANDSNLSDTPVSLSLGTASHGSVTDNGDGTVTYTPTADFHGTDSYTYTVTDSNGDSDTATVNLTVSSVNDPISANVPHTSTVSEDVLSGVGGFSIYDKDADLDPAGVYEVTLGASNGGLTLLTVTGLTFTAGDGTSDTSMTFHGTLADINTALSTLQFQGDADFNGNATISMTATDSFGGIVASGSGGGTSDTNSDTVTVNAVNDSVSITAPGTLTANEDVATAVTGLSISDVDATLAPGDSYLVSLTSSNGGMTMTALHGLTFMSGDGTDDKDVFILGTLTDINAALATLTYKSDADFHGTDDIYILATDRVGASVSTGLGSETTYTRSVPVMINAVNDAIATSAPATLTLDEDASATAVTGLSISDADAALDAGGVYEATLTATHGTLTMTTLTGLTFTAGDGTSDATMTFHGTLSAIDTALATATYLADADYNGSATISFSATDTFGGTVATGTGSATNDSDTIDVTVSAVNDAVAASAPGTATVAEDSSVAVTGLSIADVDVTLAPGGVYEVTLSASHGTLTMSTLTGLTFTSGDGTSDAAMTFHGTLAAINTALGTASYAGAADYNGSDTISFGVTDSFGGTVATGSGSASSDSQSVAVTVTAVNDTITTSAPATAAIDEDVLTAVTGVSIGDVDGALAPSGVYEATLSATNGTLTMTTLTGLTFTAGDGTSDGSMTFHGTLSDLNTALATLKYQSDADYNGSATISFSATDTFGGTVATGTGSATNDSDTIDVTVSAVNDAVAAAAPATLSADEDTATAVVGVSIADVDATIAPGGVYEVELSASHGMLTMTTLTGLTFTSGDGTSDASLTFHGTLADLNAALASLGYTGDANYHGADTITVGVTDSVSGGVAAGSGSGTSDTAAIDVTVAALNDLPTGSVSISGTALVGETLTASNTLADIDGLGTIGYQWNSDGTPIGGANASTYLIDAAYAGTTISVTASYTDLDGTAESATGTMGAPVGSEITPMPPGSTTLTGTAGGDIITGSSSTRETMIGLGGDDTYYVGKGDSVVETGGGGTDTVISDSNFALSDDVENLTLEGTKGLAASGNVLDNTIVGNSGNNRLTGFGGADTLTGGAGADKFVYLAVDDSLPAHHDVITDFSSLQKDIIDLGKIDANVLKNGNQKFTFIGSAQFSDYADATGLVRFDAGTHMLQASVDSDTAAEFQIELTGVTVLTAHDLVL